MEEKKKGGHGGARKGAGAKPKLATQVKRLEKVAEREVGRIRQLIEQCTVEGVGKLAEGFPSVLDKLLDKALPEDGGGDTQVQMFLVEKFLRFFQPDIIVAKEAPVMGYLERVKQALEAANVVTVSGRVLSDSDDEADRGAAASVLPSSEAEADDGRRAGR